MTWAACAAWKTHFSPWLFQKTMAICHPQSELLNQLQISAVSHSHRALILQALSTRMNLVFPWTDSSNIYLGQCELLYLAVFSCQPLLLALGYKTSKRISSLQTNQNNVNLVHCSAGWMFLSESNLLWCQFLVALLKFVALAASPHVDAKCSPFTTFRGGIALSAPWQN